MTNGIKIQLLHNLLDEVSSRYDYLYDANRNALEKIQYSATHDTLTGLLNRTTFEENLDRAIASAKRHGDIGAVVFMDLDNFKQVNDTIGHEEGDRLLCNVADAIRPQIRAEDLFARFGGDEFVLLIERVSDNIDHVMMIVSDLCHKILRSTERTYHVGGHTFFVTGSIGVTLFGSEEKVLSSDLIRHADVAMYEAKKRGKDQVVFFDKAIEERLHEQVLIEKKIHYAFEKDNIVLHYQPKVNQNGKTVTLEALVRIADEDGSLIYPDRFISLCEERNFIGILSEKVLSIVCHTLKEWESDECLSTIAIAINISPAWLQNPLFSKNVETILRNSGVDPCRLIFEITEGIALNNMPHKIKIMEKFVQKGIRFSLDDFGTGYSSLSYLTQLPLYEIKIDRSLIRNCGEHTTTEEDENRHRFISAIIVMAKSLKLVVTVEGVESAKGADILWKMGCDIIQGFFYSKPIDKKAVEAFILKKM